MVNTFLFTDSDYYYAKYSSFERYSRSFRCSRWPSYEVYISYILMEKNRINFDFKISEWCREIELIGFSQCLTLSFGWGSASLNTSPDQLLRCWEVASRSLKEQAHLSHLSRLFWQVKEIRIWIKIWSFVLKQIF